MPPQSCLVCLVADKYLCFHDIFINITHHAVPVVSPVPVKVGQVAVLVPPGAAVAQGAVAQGDVVVRVDGSPGLALVVGHSVAWRPSTLVSKHERYFVLTIVLHQRVT